MNKVRIFFALLFFPWLDCFAAQVASPASKISSWEISGGMAARNQNKGFNASVHWVQQGKDKYQIRLYGPIGSGSLLIVKQGNIVTIREGNRSISSSNASALLEKQTGIRLPVNNLYYWVRGIPAPGPIEGIKKDSGNRLLILKQSGYLIEFKNYAVANNLVLPTQIRLQKGRLFIKFIIRQWKY